MSIIFEAFRISQKGILDSRGQRIWRLEFTQAISHSNFPLLPAAKEYQYMRKKSTQGIQEKETTDKSQPSPFRKHQIMLFFLEGRESCDR